jgi:hypothetical protein
MLDGFIPVLRADLYAHEAAIGGGISSGITSLEIDALSIDVDARDAGVITIGVSGPDRMWDCYGVELDITSEGARRLSSQLLEAADQCERRLLER